MPSASFSLANSSLDDGQCEMGIEAREGLVVHDVSIGLKRHRARERETRREITFTSAGRNCAAPR